MRRFVKFLKYSFIVLIPVILLFNYWGPRLIVQVKFGKASKAVTALVSEQRQVEHYSKDFKRLVIESDDGLKLAGLLLKTEQVPAKGTVILVHGIRSSKEYFLPIAQWLNQRGYHALLLDQRAHGESDGKYCTFGVQEKRDVRIWVDELVAENQEVTPIGIWGQSLGGAVALQALACDDRLEFGIIESAFSDFASIVHDYFKLFLGVEMPFITDYLIWRAGQVAGFDPACVVPAQSAKQIQQPVFMVHGERDNRIDWHYARTNFDNLASTDKTFITYPEATHFNVWKMGGEDYFNQVEQFLARQSRGHRTGKEKCGRPPKD